MVVLSLYYRYYSFSTVGWARVDMEISNVSHRKISPATGPGHQSRVIQTHQILCYTDCVVLTPGLIEDDPEDDAWMIVQLRHPPTTDSENRLVKIAIDNTDGSKSFELVYHHCYE